MIEEKENNIVADFDDEPEDGMIAGDGNRELWEHYRFTAEKGQTLLRVDKFLVSHIDKTSRNRIQQAADAGCILVNGKPVKSNYRVKPFDVVSLVMDRPKYELEIIPEDIPIDIVYEDEDLLVVNKPADMPIHPSMHNYTNSLGNAAAWYFAQQNCPFVFRCINRLDHNTSGLTIIAKHLVSGSILSSRVKGREIHREYLGSVRGTLPPPSGTITAPLGRKPGSVIERTIDFENGESAVTHYQAIAVRNGHTLVRLHLETGRTHQIRIHMKYLGHPLIGDSLYNPDMEWIQRQALHSYRLCFTHPITGEAMEFTSPLPKDMCRVLWGKH